MENFKKLYQGANLPRFIISAFFLFICLLAIVRGLPFGSLLSDSIIRFGMNGILVLAMVPAIQSGIGPNFGLPIGVIAGLLGILISFELGFTGIAGFTMAVVFAVVIGTLFGWAYGLMLNRIKGSEMIVSTYTGFSIVSLMSIFWIFLPFRNGEMIWPIGTGLRNVISLESQYAKMLNDFLSLKVIKLNATGETEVLFNKSEAYLAEHFGNEFFMQFQFPTGMILFFAAIAFLMYLFTKSRTGMALRAAGDNPRFATANGVNVNMARIIGTTLSTILGAIGIIAYSQSYGYIQLYQAPLMMGFAAVAAILIGGASAKKAKISHVIIGTFLFNGLLTITLPVANDIFKIGGLPEVLRMMIQNGVILYALTKVAGGAE